MKLDNSKINSIETLGGKAYTNLETQLYNVNKSLTVLTKSLNFKGQGAEKYKAFMQDNSVNATYVLLQIGKDLKDYIENIKTGFLEFESNETGKVSSSRVEDIKTSFGEILKSVSVDIEDLVSNESKAAEYISVKSTNTNNITDGFSTIDTNLETVNNDFKTKDGELSKGAESILTSISKLDKMITNILNNYVTSSGKYNEAKFEKLKQETWYIEGDASVFDEKQKKDPYVYDTAYYSVFEGQMAKGSQKDFYAFSDISVGSISKESKTEDGMSNLSSKFDFLSGTLNIHEGPLLKATASGRILHGDLDVGEKTNGDGYLKANAELYSANLRASTLGDSLYTEIAKKTYLKAEIASYITSKKSEFGFDFGASADEVSAEAGLQLGHYFVTDADGNRVRKSLFKTEAEPKATAGGSLTLKATEEQAYDSFLGNQDWDVRVLNLKAGGSLGLGVNFDISIPYVWPDGWFK